MELFDILLNATASAVISAAIGIARSRRYYPVRDYREVKSAPSQIAHKSPGPQSSLTWGHALRPQGPGVAVSQKLSTPWIVVPHRGSVAGLAMGLGSAKDDRDSEDIIAIPPN